MQRYCVGEDRQRQGAQMDDEEKVWRYYLATDESKTEYGPFSCRQMFLWEKGHCFKDRIMFKTETGKVWMDSGKVSLTRMILAENANLFISGVRH